MQTSSSRSGSAATSRRSSGTASSGRPSSTSARARPSSAWLRRSSSRRISACGELRAGEVAERRAAPQRERAVERVERRGGREPGGRADAALEAVRVDLLGRDREPVARAVADEQRGRRAAVAAGLQERAQVRHADGERARGDVARDALPGRLEQRVGRHGPAGVEQQPREDRALLRAGRGGARGRPGDLDRAEDAEVHAGGPYGSGTAP